MVEGLLLVGGLAVMFWVIKRLESSEREAEYHRDLAAGNRYFKAHFESVTAKLSRCRSQKEIDKVLAMNDQRHL